jgi:hypothetical protein
MENKELQNQIEKLYTKNKYQCSICKKKLGGEDVISYTCTGFDVSKTLQMTSGCCKNKIIKMVSIGLIGAMEFIDYDEEMKNHPMYEPSISPAIYGEE